MTPSRRARGGRVLFAMRQSASFSICIYRVVIYVHLPITRLTTQPHQANFMRLVRISALSTCHPLRDYGAQGNQYSETLSTMIQTSADLTSRLYPRHACLLV